MRLSCRFKFDAVAALTRRGAKQGVRQVNLDLSKWGSFAYGDVTWEVARWPMVSRCLRCKRGRSDRMDIKSLPFRALHVLFNSLSKLGPPALLLGEAREGPFRRGAGGAYYSPPLCTEVSACTTECLGLGSLVLLETRRVGVAMCAGGLTGDGSRNA